MVSNGINLQIQRKVTEEVARPLSFIFEELWQSGEVPTDWKRGNIKHIFKKEDLGSYSTVSLTCVTGKIWEQTLLETLLRQ